MEIIGIGTDIIEISRIQHLLLNFKDRFVNKIFLQSEEEYCTKKRYPEIHFAGKFAGKEAVIKSLDSLLSRISFKDIEIKNNPNGKPEVFLTDILVQTNKQLQDINFEISISHSQSIANAFVICFRS
ncbi:holo-ACP synthase [Candidatus Dependentiae bacterium]|nr:holo-ACP synthase [Candidatus Dependentiae bacterium]